MICQEGEVNQKIIIDKYQMIKNTIIHHLKEVNINNYIMKKINNKEILKKNMI